LKRKVFRAPEKGYRREKDMPDIRAKHLTLVAAVVELSSVLAMAQKGDMDKASLTNVEQKLTGTVTCTGRLTRLYSCQRNQTLQTCTLACVERGSEFTLLVVDKPYVLDVSRRTIESYAGGMATVTGIVTGDHVQVSTVFSAKRKASDPRTVE